jgi:hypothetical protein
MAHLPNVGVPSRAQAACQLLSNRKLAVPRHGGRAERLQVGSERGAKEQQLLSAHTCS